MLNSFTLILGGPRDKTIREAIWTILTTYNQIVLVAASVFLTERLLISVSRVREVVLFSR